MERQPDVSVTALRRLAQGLLYDRHGAEDVVQEAWLAALCARPEAPRLGAWLNEAVKRLARNRRREEARRRAREETAARAEALPGADERSAQIEILRRLLDALDRLDEPYRAAVMLRYLDDLPPREIARRLGVPVNTARTHVRRGLERLRRDLDGERGRERQGLLAALAPFAGEPPWTGAAWRGATLAQDKAWLVGALGILIGVSWVVLRMAAGRNDGALELASAESAVASTSPAEESSGASAHVSENRKAREPVASTAAATAATWVVRGHAFAGRNLSFPHLPLVGRVHAGPDAEGTPLVEERFATDDAGDFAWAIAPPADLVTVSIEPEIDEHVTEGRQDIFIPGDPAPERWTVGAYARDSTVRGVVRDTEGRPVPGARVGAFEELIATSDEAGRYSLRVSSYYYLLGWEDQLFVSAPGFVNQGVTLDPDPPGEILVPDVVLRSGVQVHGRVVDVDGAPVEGAKVYSESASDRTTLTDEQGAFELGDLDPMDRNQFFAAVKLGYSPASQESVPVDLESEIEIRLVRSVRVTGEVFTPDGAPVWGALITVGDLGVDPFGLPCWAYSDREGRFAIESVAPGRQRFWLQRRGFAKTPVDVKVPRHTDTFDVELSFGGEDHFVSGLVLDEQDAPVPWTRIQVTDARYGPFVGDYGETYTGPDGRFRVDGLPAKKVNLKVYDGDLVRIDEELSELDRDDLVLRMKPTSFLAGKVIEADTGDPILSFLVRVGSPPAEFDKEGKWVITYPRPRRFSAADGGWTIETADEPGQAFSLEVEAEGHVQSSVELVRTSSAPSPDDLVVHMVRSTSVRGRVVERDTGVPIADARIRRFTPDQQLEYLDNSNDPVFEHTTDSGGRFELADVPLGIMSLAVEASGRALVVDGPFTVSDSTPIQRTIEIGPGATIRGRLLDSSGNSIEGLTIELEALTGAQRDHKWRATTDGQGGFSFAGLPAGLFVLNWAEYRDGEWIYWLRQHVEVSSDAIVETVLQMNGHATLCGTLEFDGELPEKDSVWVVPVPSEPRDPARDRWSRSSWVVPIEHGGFCLERLEPGEYEVSAEFDLGVTNPEDPFDEGNGYASGEARVIVPEEGVVQVHVLLDRHEH